MKLRKRIFSLFCAAALAMTMMAGCSTGEPVSSPSSEAVVSDESSADTTSEEASEAADTSSEAASETESADDVTIRIGALKGPTGLGMLKMMQEANDAKSRMNYACRRCR